MRFMNPGGMSVPVMAAVRFRCGRLHIESHMAAWLCNRQSVAVPCRAAFTETTPGCHIMLAIGGYRKGKHLAGSSS